MTLLYLKNMTVSTSLAIQVPSHMGVLRTCALHNQAAYDVKLKTIDRELSD